MHGLLAANHDQVALFCPFNSGARGGRQELPSREVLIFSCRQRNFLAPQAKASSWCFDAPYSYLRQRNRA